MHGTVPPDAPIALFDPIQWWTEPAVDALVDRGYGVALSSYRVNGFAVREGAIDTRTARAMFVA